LQISSARHAFVTALHFSSKHSRTSVVDVVELVVVVVVADAMVVAKVAAVVVAFFKAVVADEVEVVPVVTVLAGATVETPHLLYPARHPDPSSASDLHNPAPDMHCPELPNWHPIQPPLPASVVVATVLAVVVVAVLVVRKMHFVPCSTPL
jgi:hypothetical protein